MATGKDWTRQTWFAQASSPVPHPTPEDLEQLLLLAGP